MGLQYNVRNGHFPESMIRLFVTECQCPAHRKMVAISIQQFSFLRVFDNFSGFQEHNEFPCVLYTVLGIFPQNFRQNSPAYYTCYRIIFEFLR